MTDTRLTRKEIVALTGVSKSKIHNVSKSQFLNFPPPAGKRGREDVWKETDILDWLATHDITADLPALTTKDTPSCPSKLDNTMAQAFLTAHTQHPNRYD